MPKSRSGIEKWKTLGKATHLLLLFLLIFLWDSPAPHSSNSCSSGNRDGSASSPAARLLTVFCSSVTGERQKQKQCKGKAKAKEKIKGKSKAKATQRQRKSKAKAKAKQRQRKRKDKKPRQNKGNTKAMQKQSKGKAKATQRQSKGNAKVS